jgi:hypothetical protein
LKTLEDDLRELIAETDDIGDASIPAEPAKYGIKFKDSLKAWGSTRLSTKTHSEKDKTPATTKDLSSPSAVKDAINEEIVVSSSSSSLSGKKINAKPPVLRDEIRSTAVANTPLSADGYRLNTQDLQTQVLNLVYDYSKIN